MARASGKVILLGEHAVVYGAPALAAGLELGAVAKAVPAEVASLEIGGHWMGAEAREKTGSERERELARGLDALLRALGAPPLAITAELELPPGAGLGASAALGVAMSRAVLETLEPGVELFAPATRARVLAGAAAWEGVFHGNPSGIDAAAAEGGGCIHFTRAEGPTRVHVLRALPLVVAIAGPPASTREMVAGVARLFERRPDTAAKTIAAVGSLVRNARLCIEAGDLPGLGKLMDLNQMLLAGLMLSTEPIERACAAARDAGALGAKLTGAGGGGAVIALADIDPEPVLAAIRSEGFSCFATNVRATAGAV